MQDQIKVINMEGKEKCHEVENTEAKACKSIASRAMHWATTHKSKAKTAESIRSTNEGIKVSRKTKPRPAS